VTELALFPEARRAPAVLCRRLRRRIVALEAQGFGPDAIARRLRLGPKQVRGSLPRAAARRERDKPYVLRQWEPVVEQQEFPEESDTIPSPEEIRRRCLEIQKCWSDRERAVRAGLGRRSEDEWTPPSVRVAMDDD
jgi:hypothetical protein